jgi:hypothetical protein
MLTDESIDRKFRDFSHFSPPPLRTATLALSSLFFPQETAVTTPAKRLQISGFEPVLI